jgi:catechol 2,3-dioxygenase-like lactoylglutathione lyase family enzyme
MQIRKLDHVAINTAKLAETQAFFVEVLGLTVGPRPQFDFNGVWLYAAGEDMVHLVEVDDPRAASTAAALNHFALRVIDYEQTVRSLQEAGVPFEAETTPGGELRQLYVTDPNGVRIELNAPGPGAGEIG